MIHESNAVSQGFARRLLKEGDHETGQDQAIRSSWPSNGKNQGPKSSFAAEYGICTSPTGFVVEPENLRIRGVTCVDLYLNISNGLVLNGCLVHDGASSRGSDDGYVGTPQAALIRRKSSTIGVGRTDYIPFRLPPYRTVPAVVPHTRKTWGHCLLCHCFGVFGEAVFFVCCGLRSRGRSISIW